VQQCDPGRPGMAVLASSPSRGFNPAAPIDMGWVT
jgi:hypothetical protein